MAKITLKDFDWYISARAIAGNMLHDAAAALGYGLASYRAPTRVEEMRTVRELKRRRHTLMTLLDAMQLFSLVRATAKLGGCMAEVGVYQGGSARLIREADASRSLHLFDTFEGLPELAAIDTPARSGRFRKGLWSCPLESVRNYFGDCDRVHFHKGLFPVTGEGVKDERFSFVHADVNLYSSTWEVLKFFYPRLLRGGILVSHDFTLFPGVREAMEEFFKDLPEPVIELSGNQAMVVKV